MRGYQSSVALGAALLILITLSSLHAGESEEDLSMKAQNPLANLMSFPFQNNTNFGIGPYNRTQNVLNIQPVIPFMDGRLITRTILPVVWQPYIEEPTGRTTGLGDLTFTAFYTPNSGGVTWGVGPVFMAPTGGCDRGSEKWSLGASGVVVASLAPWVVGALINNVWSVAGDSERSDVNFMTLQYFINYNFPSFYLSSAPYHKCELGSAKRPAVDRPLRYRYRQGYQPGQASHQCERAVLLQCCYAGLRSGMDTSAPDPVPGA